GRARTAAVRAGASRSAPPAPEQAVPDRSFPDSGGQSRTWLTGRCAGRENRRTRELQPRLRRFGRVRGRPRQHVVADWTNPGGKKRRRDSRAKTSGNYPPAQDRRAQDDTRRGLAMRARTAAAHRSIAVIHRATPSKTL